MLSTGTVDEPLDFTVMLWFKVDRDLPDDIAQEIMYLFQFQEGAACYITSRMSILCDSHDRRKLQINSHDISKGKWYHLTLSCSEDKSLLIIQDNQKIIAMDEQSSFLFKQTQMYRWKICLGDCKANFGFQGGIRELILMQKKLTLKDSAVAKNTLFTYDSTFKAYFRFQDLDDMFDKDQFVDRQWLYFKNQPADRSDYVGVDIIPNDVCPIIQEQ